MYIYIHIIWIVGYKQQSHDSDDSPTHKVDSAHPPILHLGCSLRVIPGRAAPPRMTEVYRWESHLEIIYKSLKIHLNPI